MERQFKGVWIPAEIWLDKRLTICEKAFLAEIDSFAGNGKTFYKSNETIQEEYGIAPRTVQRMVKKLVELGLLESSFNGRVRHLSIGSLAKMTGQGRQNDDSDSPKWRHTNTRDNTSTCTSTEEGVVMPWDSEKFEEAWTQWKEYKRDEFRFRFKSTKSEQAQLHRLQTLSRGDETVAIGMIHEAIGQTWKGFYEPKTKNNATKRPGPSDGSLIAEHLRRLAAQSGESLA
jgi:hypothetical protein